mgnify:CR=1 FL=1
MREEAAGVVVMNRFRAVSGIAADGARTAGVAPGCARFTLLAFRHASSRIPSPNRDGARGACGDARFVVARVAGARDRRVFGSGRRERDGRSEREPRTVNWVNEKTERAWVAEVRERAERLKWEARLERKEGVKDANHGGVFARGIVNDNATFYHAKVTSGTNLSPFRPHWTRKICGYRKMPDAAAGALDGTARLLYNTVYT